MVVAGQDDGDYRTRWQGRGLSLQGAYTLDLSTVVAGEPDDDSSGRGLFELGLAIDGQKLFGLHGSSLFIGGHSFRGRNGSERIGDIQVYSNIDADEIDTVAEAWFEQRFSGGRTRLKLGLVDANSEFAVVDAAAEFANSSAGYSPTILTLPTYPKATLGLNVFVEPTTGTRIGAGLYRSPLGRDSLNDASEPLFAIGEIGLSWIGTSGTWGGGRMALGAWHDSGRLERFDGVLADGTEGLYLTLEQSLRTRNIADDTGELRLFVQHGRSDPDFSAFAQHWSLGLSRERARREKRESFGVMVSFVDLSDAVASPFAGNETVVELFYGLDVGPFMRLQPDIQYVRHPSGEENRSALVAMLRLKFFF